MLVAIALVPLLGSVLATPAPTNGDDLSAALARQKSLAAKIASQKKQIANLTAMQASLQSDVADTRVQLAGVNADLAAMKKRVSRVGAELADVRSTYNDLVAQLSELDGEMRDLEAQELAKANELATRKSILGQRLRAAYETGRTSLLETVLSASSFTDVISQVGYYLDYSAQDKALADQIQHDTETLAAIHSTVLQTRVQTEDLRVETASQRDALNARLADLKDAQAQLKKLEQRTNNILARQRSALAKLTKNKRALKADIAKDEAAEEALKKKIDDLVRQQFQHGNIPSVFNGTMEWPMGGTVSQEFGCTGFALEPPLGNCAHFHRGIDVVAPAFTPIRAAADGTVVFVGPNPYDPYPKAWIVIIAHSANLQTWYAHIDNGAHGPVVHAGQFVRQGDVIAYEGMTGRTTGYHLHWAVEYNDAFVNPRLFV